MFPIFNATGDRMSLDWNGTTFGTGTSDSIIQIEGFSVRDVFTGSMEPYPDRASFEAYGVFHNSKLIRINGIVRAATKHAAMTAFNTFVGKFNPYVLYHQNMAAAGFAILQWTDAGATHSYEARPVQIPDLITNVFQGANIPFQIDLIAKPWRKQGSASGAISDGGTVTNSGDTIGWPTLSWTLAASGGSTFKIKNNNWPYGEGITLDIDAYPSGAFVIDTEKRSITRDGSPIDHSILNSDWFGLMPGNNVMSITGGPPSSVTFARATHYWSK